MDPNATLDPRALGSRLRQIREGLGWTQQSVGARLGVARTTVVAIEKGERRLLPEELVRVSELYGEKLSDLLQRKATASEGFAVQLRAALTATRPIDSELLPSIADFERLAEDYSRLEEICQAPPRRRFPPPYDLLNLDPESAGEDLASRERSRLGLGEGPLVGLRDLLENDVGIRTFQPELPSRIAGMFAFTEALGACIAVNRRHPPERRAFTWAHEYGHFLVDRFRSEVLATEGGGRARSERLADAFARFFLMPTEGLRRRFRELERDRDGGVTRGDLCRFASYYMVSVEAMTRRLEEIRLVPAGTWDRLRVEGFKVQEARRLLGLAAPNDDLELLPARFVSLAVEAWERGDLSEGQLAAFLRTDRLCARRLVERSLGAEGSIDWSAPLLRDAVG